MKDKRDRWDKLNDSWLGFWVLAFFNANLIAGFLIEKF